MSVASEAQAVADYLLDVRDYITESMAGIPLDGEEVFRLDVQALTQAHDLLKSHAALNEAAEA